MRLGPEVEDQRERVRLRLGLEALTFGRQASAVAFGRKVRARLVRATTKEEDERAEVEDCYAERRREGAAPFFADVDSCRRYEYRGGKEKLTHHHPGTGSEKSQICWGVRVNKGL